MSEQNPYERLGVSESSSFDEIQGARNRLGAAFKDDPEQLRKVEAAYDAVLMDRLKMRQEGRIKVPDGIRFAERQAEVPSSPPQTTGRRLPPWLERFVDTPSPADIWMPAGVMAALITLVVVSPAAVQVALIGGLGATFYFLYRKEKKLGRAVLLGFAGLIVGLVAGGFLFELVRSQLSLSVDAFASAFTFFVLWIISGFLR